MGSVSGSQRKVDGREVISRFALVNSLARRALQSSPIAAHPAN